MNYYYTQNNETKGPLPAANLLEAIDSGELNNETKICPVGGTQWHIPTDYPKLFHDGCDVYEVGAELALKSCFIIYSHFATLSLELLDLHESQKATAKETPKEIKGPSKSAEELLASCYEVAIMVSESMPHALAFLVSRCTLREEIRLKTINELTSLFKGDAFASYDQKIDLFRNQISELGIQLASKSSIREAAKGAAVGAGIQLLATRGKAGLAGGVAGAVIGAALEEAKKAELRKQMLNTATEGVINIILELEKLAVGMLDQYSLLLMGNERSPSKLDLATDQLRSKIRLLNNNAQNLFRKTVDFNKILDQVKEPENDAEILNTKYVYGSGGYTAEEKKKIGSKKLWIMRGYASLGLLIFGGTVLGIIAVPIVYFKKSKPWKKILKEGKAGISDDPTDHDLAREVTECINLINSERDQIENQNLATSRQRFYLK